MKHKETSRSKRLSPPFSFSVEDAIFAKVPDQHFFIWSGDNPRLNQRVSEATESVRPENWPPCEAYLMHLSSSSSKTALSRYSPTVHSNKYREYLGCVQRNTASAGDSAGKEASYYMRGILLILAERLE